MTDQTMVWVVEKHDYEDSWVVAVWATRELAERFVALDRRQRFEAEGRKAERRVTGYSFSVADGNLLMEPQPDGYTLVTPVEGKGTPTGYEDIPAETFEAFCARTSPLDIAAHALLTELSA